LTSITRFGTGLISSRTGSSPAARNLAPSKPVEDALGLTYAQTDDLLEGKKIDAEARQRVLHIKLSAACKRQPIAIAYEQKLLPARIRSE